jgi:hypothetical protein
VLHGLVQAERAGVGRSECSQRERVRWAEAWKLNDSVIDKPTMLLCGNHLLQVLSTLPRSAWHYGADYGSSPMSSTCSPRNSLVQVLHSLPHSNLLSLSLSLSNSLFAGEPTQTWFFRGRKKKTKKNKIKSFYISLLIDVAVL